MAMLEATDSANMLFCFRWLIVSFKREFSFEDIKRVWEVGRLFTFELSDSTLIDEQVTWTHHLTSQFELFIACAILINVKNSIVSDSLEFDNVLQVFHKAFIIMISDDSQANQSNVGEARRCSMSGQGRVHR